MTALLPLGEWRPDNDVIDSEFVSQALNVYPSAAGYWPAKGLSPVSQALPSTCVGAVSARLADGSFVFYAGTQTGLYRFNNIDGSWTDVSKSGSAATSGYSIPPGEFWGFVQYGSKLLALHVNALPQVVDVDLGGTFDDLSPDAPRARFGTVIADQVILGGLLDYPRRVHWSGIDNISSWIAGNGDGADFQDLPDAGNVTGFSGGENNGLIFQERAIRRMAYTSNADNTFQIDKAEDGRGAVGPWSVLKLGATTYFLDRDGFYSYAAGVGSAPISDQKISRWFTDRASKSSLTQVVAVRDISAPRVFWAFNSTAASDPQTLDVQLCYNWVLQRWTALQVATPGIRYWITAATPGIALDAITEDIDGGTNPYSFASGLSLDSAIFQGGVPTVAVFDSSNAMNFLEGATLEASFETGPAFPSRPQRTYVGGVRVDGDMDDVRVTVGAQESLGAPVAWGVERGPQADRFAPARSEGRYVRARIRIPAGTGWSFVQGLEANVSATGLI